MGKMCYWVGREICRELSAILTKEPCFREALQHMFYRPAAIQSDRRGHKEGQSHRHVAILIYAYHYSPTKRLVKDGEMAI